VLLHPKRPWRTKVSESGPEAVPLAFPRKTDEGSREEVAQKLVSTSGMLDVCVRRTLSHAIAGKDERRDDPFALELTEVPDCGLDPVDCKVLCHSLPVQTASAYALRIR
jgi:hypothetical protein